MKTTKKDFELFKNRHQYWCNYFGIKNWRIYYEHKKLDDSYALTSPRYYDRLTVVTLGTEDVDNNSMDRLALHEVLHLLISPLSGRATDRFTTEQELNTAEHEVIWTLESIILDKTDG